MQCIMTKYIGPTDTRGARIRAMAANGKNFATISYPSEDSRNAHSLAALKLARKLGWTGTLIEGSTPTGSVFVFASGDKFEI